MIAAGILGLVALIALYLAFGRTLFGSSSTTATVKISPTPAPGVRPGKVKDDKPLPTVSEQDFVYQTTPVDYRPGSAYAPDPGRNIFAFYEPPPPTPYVPTPIPVVTVKPATPTPTPVYAATSANPQAIYAGSSAFRLEVNGDRFTPDAHIYFNQTELPTIYINPQKLVADIPANFIAQEGPRQIIVQSPDGKAYSDQLMLNVQAPPRPTFQYIGMIGRKRYNNDTAYFVDPNKPPPCAGCAVPPFGARLNDIVSGRFRLVDIAASEVIFEDVNLGFRHRVPISRMATGTGQPGRGNADGNFMPNGDIPGIPGGVPRYVPPQPKKTPSKDDDVDDNGDGDGGGD